jgi:hypothetical protein
MDKYMDRFEGFGKKFYDKYEKQMQNQAYGSWQTMMYESLVRVCEVRYAMATSGPELAQHVADYQVTRGFVWTTEFSQLFDEYEQHRDKYPTLESFMPRIIEFFEEYKNTND